MKITAEEWLKYFPKIGAEVIGDGKVIDKVVFMDTVNGIVERYKTDKDGSIMLNADKTEAQTEILHFESVQLRVLPR